MRRCLLPAVLVVATGCGDKRADGPAQPESRLAPAGSAEPLSSTVSVTGAVVDRDTREHVGDVEVVLRGEQGDVSTRTRTDGTFSVAVARGDYRVFVRDSRVMSTGLQARMRVRTLPRAELAGVADEQLMPVITVDADTSGIELSVTVGALINGVAVDSGGQPVENAVIRAVPIESSSAGVRPNIGPPIARRAAPLPVLGTDTVITDARGQFVLRVPAGRYELIADHPKFAGVAGLAEVELDAGTRVNPTLTLARGCIITGKVVGIGGAPPHDGALEVIGGPLDSFGPSGRVNPDGTFRWTTTEDRFVSMRAWPWKSPPSPPQTFECSEGKRYNNVVLRVGNSLPDLAGTISDARGNPVPLAYLDIRPLDPGVNGQQERADAAGSWHVYDLPAGRYQINVHAVGRGIVSTMVVSPRRDVNVQLDGTGRLAGTTTALVDGTFELTLDHCGSANDFIDVDEDTRLVVVRGGRFTVDDVPACTLSYIARWRDHAVSDRVVVEPERTAFLELALGPARDKTVHGTVRDAGGNAVANARVTALVGKQEANTVRTDGAGKFSVTTQSGAQLIGGNGKLIGRATVGRANVASEQVDIVLDDDYDE